MYEYKQVSVKVESPEHFYLNGRKAFFEDIEKYINELARDGWRVKTCTPIAALDQYGNPSTVRLFYLFERKVEI